MYLQWEDVAEKTNWWRKKSESRDERISRWAAEKCGKNSSGNIILRNEAWEGYVERAWGSLSEVDGITRQLCWKYIMISRTVGKDSREPHTGENRIEKLKLKNHEMKYGNIAREFQRVCSVVGEKVFFHTA